MSLRILIPEQPHYWERDCLFNLVPRLFSQFNMAPDNKKTPLTGRRLQKSPRLLEIYRMPNTGWLGSDQKSCSSRF